jgi:hypothetical protein
MSGILMLIVTNIYSIAGKMPRQPLVWARLFRAPRHRMNQHEGAYGTLTLGGQPVAGCHDAYHPALSSYR